MKVYIYTGSTTIETTAGTLAKAEALAREQMGDDPNAFAWLNYGKVNYTVLPGGQKMTKDNMGRDSWMLLKENKMEENTSTNTETAPAAAEPEMITVKHTVKVGEMIVHSLTGMILEFDYVDKQEQASHRQALLFKGIKVTTPDGEHMRYEAVATLRPEDPEAKKRTWGLRKFFAHKMTNVVEVGPITKEHPAVEMLRNLKGEPITAVIAELRK